MRRTAVLVALIALLFPAVPASADIPTVRLGTQAWWNRAGLSIPSVSDHHLHLDATIPAPGVIVNGRVDVPVDLILHNQVGTPNYVRWSDGSTVLGKVTLTRSMFTCQNEPGITDCRVSVVLPIDFSRFGTGLRELRLTLNVPDEDPTLSGSQRMYNSTGWEICVRACSPVAISGRSQNYVEARGWYTDHEYANARITSGLSSVRAGGTVTVKIAPGSGGKPTKRSVVTLDPDMHHGNAGRVLLDRAGSYSGTVTIPSDLASGSHKLVLISSDGQNAGVLVIPFTVP